MYFFCRPFQGGADFVYHFLILWLSSPGDIFVKNLTFTLYCGGCVGRRGGNQDVVRLVLTGCGIAVPEIFRVIREDSQCFKFVSLCPKSHLIPLI